MDNQFPNRFLVLIYQKIRMRLHQDIENRVKPFTRLYLPISTHSPNGSIKTGPDTLRTPLSPNSEYRQNMILPSCKSILLIAVEAAVMHWSSSPI